MGGGANNSSPLAKYAHEMNLAHSFQSFNTCYKVKINTSDAIEYPRYTEISHLLPTELVESKMGNIYLKLRLMIYFKQLSKSIVVHLSNI